MSKIYVTSDFHFGHEKFFIYTARGYQTIQEMNEDLVRKFNSVVSNDDDVYILGDLVLGDIGNIEYVRELNGRLHVVLGNHDTNMRAAEYRTSCPNIVEVADVGIKLDYGKYHFALTHFPMLTNNIEKEYLKQMTLNLFGHTHQTTNFYNNLPFCYVHLYSTYK